MWAVPVPRCSSWRSLARNSPMSRFCPDAVFLEPPVCAGWAGGSGPARLGLEPSSEPVPGGCQRRRRRMAPCNAAEAEGARGSWAAPGWRCAQAGQPCRRLCSTSSPRVQQSWQRLTGLGWGSSGFELGPGPCRAARCSRGGAGGPACPVSPRGPGECPRQRKCCPASASWGSEGLGEQGPVGPTRAACARRGLGGCRSRHRCGGSGGHGCGHPVPGGLRVATCA